MRSTVAGMLGLVAAAVVPAAAQDYAPLGTVMLFHPGSAEVTPQARDALLAFLRPPRPPEFRGHCITGHADRDAGAASFAQARAHAVAAMMQRQGVDSRDIAVESRGDAQPVRLTPPGQAEPMNDRVELFPCPGPRLAGVAEAEARAMDAVVVPAFVAALAPRVARSLGCPEPEVPRGALVPPPFACPAGTEVPSLSVLRIAGTRRVAVILEWRGGARGGWNAPAAAVLDLFGHAPAAPVLAALGAQDGAARRSEFLAGGVRAEVEIGPGALRRLHVVPQAKDAP
ncbi:OmpA family protein [Roseomonas fluvialis]|uniref:OmpA-like domain-containing protein n=1 Tax=Roseomonas fluvialis TaxID=1750527 RepID=A0ABN6NYF8_9PROT|nr:OmpA family protein [Roseomonas fluvialis]BDG71444.1 hypothetical protein Rmf_13730 [Roseomonas fluvialis]